MKKFVFVAIAVIAVFSIALYIDAQPAGGGMGMGGGMGFGAGGGGGMGMGAGMGGGQRGGRGLRTRPDKKARLAAVADLEKQVAALKAAVEKAPAEDPNIAKLEGNDLTKFMDTFTVESNAINNIQATLASLSGAGARGGRNAGVPAEDVLTELAGLAKDEEATKTAARIDALIQQAQERATRGGGRGAGGAGGFGGGRGGAN